MGVRAGSSDTPASKFDGCRLHPDMSHVATVIKTKQKVTSVNVSGLVYYSLKKKRVNYFSFKLRTMECRFPSLSRLCWPWSSVA